MSNHSELKQFISKAVKEALDLETELEEANAISTGGGNLTSSGQIAGYIGPLGAPGIGSSKKLQKGFWRTDSTKKVKTSSPELHKPRNENSEFLEAVIEAIGHMQDPDTPTEKLHMVKLLWSPEERGEEVKTDSPALHESQDINNDLEEKLARQYSELYEEFQTLDVDETLEGLEYRTPIHLAIKLTQPNMGWEQVMKELYQEKERILGASLGIKEFEVLDVILAGIKSLDLNLPEPPEVLIPPKKLKFTGGLYEVERSDNEHHEDMRQENIREYTESYNEFQTMDAQAKEIVKLTGYQLPLYITLKFSQGDLDWQDAYDLLLEEAMNLNVNSNRRWSPFQIVLAGLKSTGLELPPPPSKKLREADQANKSLMKSMGYDYASKSNARLGSDTFVYSNDKNKGRSKTIAAAVNKNLDKTRKDPLHDPSAMGISLPKKQRG